MAPRTSQTPQINYVYSNFTSFSPFKQLFPVLLDKTFHRAIRSGKALINFNSSFGLVIHMKVILMIFISWRFLESLPSPCLWALPKNRTSVYSLTFNFQILEDNSQALNHDIWDLPWVELSLGLSILTHLPLPQLCNLPWSSIKVSCFLKMPHSSLCLPPQHTLSPLSRLNSPFPLPLPYLPNTPPPH